MSWSWRQRSRNHERSSGCPAAKAKRRSTGPEESRPREIAYLAVGTAALVRVAAGAGGVVVAVVGGRHLSLGNRCFWPWICN